MRVDLAGCTWPFRSEQAVRRRWHAPRGGSSGVRVLAFCAGTATSATNHGTRKGLLHDRVASELACCEYVYSGALWWCLIPLRDGHAIDAAGRRLQRKALRLSGGQRVVPRLVGSHARLAAVGSLVPTLAWGSDVEWEERQRRSQPPTSPTRTVEALPDGYDASCDFQFVSCSGATTWQKRAGTPVGSSTGSGAGAWGCVQRRTAPRPCDAARGHARNAVPVRSAHGDRMANTPPMPAELGRKPPVHVHGALNRAYSSRSGLASDGQVPVAASWPQAACMPGERWAEPPRVRHSA